MAPILSFELLPNRNSNGTGTSLVRISSFSRIMLDK